MVISAKIFSPKIEAFVQQALCPTRFPFTFSRMATDVISKVPKKIPHYAAFHQALHCAEIKIIFGDRNTPIVLRRRDTKVFERCFPAETMEILHLIELLAADPFKYKMDNSVLIVSISE